MMAERVLPGLKAPRPTRGPLGALDRRGRRAIPGRRVRLATRDLLEARAVQDRPEARGILEELDQRA